MNNIGFIVWGIRNGFKNNWLSANVSPTVYERFTDDMRQICNSTVDKFFSIEKIEEYTVLSIFNPNTKDHVQRKAYIALSIVIPNGYNLQGDVIDCLQSMMKTYEVKQGNAMVNMVSAEDMNVFLKQLQLGPNPNSVSISPIKTGIFQYNDTSEISSYFQDPSIYDFKKVFFTNTQNVALNRMSGIQQVQFFIKPLFLTILGLRTDMHRVSINNQPITTSKVHVKQGDVVQFVEVKSKQAKQLKVGISDMTVSMLEVFPPIIMTPTPPKSPKAGGKKKIMVIGLLAFVFTMLSGVAFYILKSPEEQPQPVVDDPAPRNKKMIAIYDFKTLELQNIPKDIDSTFGFIVFKLTNDPVPLDTLRILNPTSNITKLKKVSDTLIVVKYQIGDIKLSDTLEVEFKVPSTHQIKSREGLLDIAERFDIKKDSLMIWNNIKDENKINQGQKLYLKPQPSQNDENVQGNPEEKETPKNEPEADAPTEKVKEKPKVETTPVKQEDKSEEQQKIDSENELTKLKKEIKQLISKVRENGENVTILQSKKNSCNDLLCLKKLKQELERKTL